MKKFYLHILLLCFVTVAFGQTPLFEITSPVSISGALNFGASNSVANGATQPAWGYQLKNLNDNVAGEVSIAVDSTLTDSTKRLENCTALGTGANVKGKYALIRRGTCGFSTKAFNAFKAGAIGVIIYSQETNPNQVFDGLSLNALGDTVVKIPVILISNADGQKMVKIINSGTKVTVNYRFATLYNAGLYYNYATPLKEAGPIFPFISASKYFKLATGDTAQIKAQMRIIEPDGVVKLSSLYYGTIGTDPTMSDTSTRTFSLPSYTPSKVGKYQVSFLNNKNADVFKDSFVITNYTFAQDQFLAGGGYVGLQNSAFVSGNLILDVGHVFYNGTSPDKATHAMFALANPDSFPKGEQFTFQLYEINEAIKAKIRNNTLAYSDMTSSGIGVYTKTGLEKVDSLMVVEFKTPIALNDNSQYLLMVKYDGSSGKGITQSPLFTVAGYNPSSFDLDDVIFAYNSSLKQNIFYAGWGGTQPKNVVRLAMAGFKPGTIDTKTTEAWAENQVTIFPNPVNTQLTLNFDLQTLNPTVDYLITSVEGLEIKAGQFKNVQTGTQTINVSEFANGLYFVRLLGTDGWRTKAFVVTK